MQALRNENLPEEQETRTVVKNNLENSDFEDNGRYLESNSVIISEEKIRKANAEINASVR